MGNGLTRESVDETAPPRVEHHPATAPGFSLATDPACAWRAPTGLLPEMQITGGMWRNFSLLSVMFSSGVFVASPP